MKPKFIVVSGVIGVGKTTFTKQLADHLGFRAIYEPVESNPYLALFYEDPKKWAYPMQEFLKSRRFAAYQYAFWGLRHGEFPGVVLDRSIHEDTVFAEINNKLGTITDLDWETYLRGFQDFQTFLPEPDLYVFLDAPPELCHERTKRRGREAESGKTGFDEKESGIPLAYLKTLHAGYMKWLDAIAPRMQVVKLDWREYKPIPETWAEVERRFEERSRFTRSLVAPVP